MNKALKVVITGSTGMVGEGVLYVCLKHPDVGQILVINRKPCGVVHSKLKEIIHPDFFNLSPIADQLSGYDACFFCLGISSIGMKEQEYYKTTYALTMHVAQTLVQQNSAMTFCYISGAGTDSTEKGRSMWARVKGKTENDLMRLNFKNFFALRPGFIKPIKGLKYTHSFYRYINWLYPVGRSIYPRGFCTMEELALCLIHLTQRGYSKNIIEGKDIIKLAQQ